jgi:hypothetical protein
MSPVREELPSTGDGTRLEAVELFRPGEWNGHRYTADDVRLVALAARWLAERVPVRLSHGGVPVGAAGNFRVRDDGTLLADLELSAAAAARMRAVSAKTGLTHLRHIQPSHLDPAVSGAALVATEP